MHCLGACVDNVYFYTNFEHGFFVCVCETRAVSNHLCKATTVCHVIETDDKFEEAGYAEIRTTARVVLQVAIRRQQVVRELHGDTIHAKIVVEGDVIP